MKFRKTLLSLALFLTPFLIFKSIAQPGETGQRLQIAQGRTVLGTFGANGVAAESGNANPVSIIDATPLTFEALDGTIPSVGNRLCQGVNNGECGWYKAFWIFGDGNYMKFPDDISTLDAASRSVVGYRYFQQGSYKPVVYLTEKYHNSKPPEAARAQINIAGSGASGTPIEPTVRLANNPDRKVDIDYNHNPRPGYPMNFVLSYRRGEPVTTLLLYYNALGNESFNPLVPTALMRHKTSETAAYHTTAFTPEVIDDMAAAAAPPYVFGSPSILDLLNSKFKSRLRYNVADPAGAFIEGVSELRVFPVLESFKMNELPGGILPAPNRPASFACILVGPDSIGGNDPARGRLLKLALTLFGNNFTGSLRVAGANSPQYIRGIELLNLTMDASHDPNGLIVTDIRDLGNGKFRVSFKLTVCNKGTGTETNPNFTFNDLTGGHYAAQPVWGDTDGSVPAWTGGTPGVSWSATLPNFQITGVPPNYDPSCRELTFTMETDAAGVARLYDETPRALEVCVQFSAGAGECNPNDALFNKAFQKEDGSYPALGERIEPVNPVTPTAPKGLLCIILGLVILAILFWYFFKRQDA